MARRRTGSTASAARERTGKSPDAYRTIGEAADELGVPRHVLRFWETRFSQLRPMKRAGARRYYRPEDIALIGRIRDLLYEEGYSIRGVRKLLKSGGVRGLAENPAGGETRGPADELELREVLAGLVELRDMLR